MGPAARVMAAGIAGIGAVAAGASLALRLRDARADSALRDELLALAARPPAPAFDPAMADDLPEPARRLFRFAIAPGTPLRMAARIVMAGRLDLGTKDVPRDRPMRATQVLAPPHGFVWAVWADGVPPVGGTDALGPGASWSRFRLGGLVPVGRAGGDADHLRSSFGRMVGEGLFWTPAAFLPAAGAGWDAIAWRALGPDTAEVHVRAMGLEQSATVAVDAAGRPLWVAFERWSDANAARRWRMQPFGGELAGFRWFGGFRLPTRVNGGNHFGTAEYWPFFRAEVHAVTFR